MRWIGAIAAIVLWAGASAAAFEVGRANMPVLVNGEPALYETAFAAVMPGARVVLDAPIGHGLALRAADGSETRGFGRLEWHAPFEPGYYPLQVIPEGGSTIRLQLFVMVPAWQMREGQLNGYEIGTYPLEPLEGKEIYERPEGFIEVREAQRWIPVSPHFTLGQFLSKQESGWPKYMLLRPRLLIKLERLLEAVNARGIAANSLHIMSGYRTPAYNARLGNVEYSRHLWGGAADVYIDAAPIDLRMDDLSGDGRSDRRDAAHLFDIAAELGERPAVPRLIGGVGEYGATAAHGPFVHVDVRGFKARWGRRVVTADAPSPVASGSLSGN